MNSKHSSSTFGNYNPSFNSVVDKENMNCRVNCGYSNCEWAVEKSNGFKISSKSNLNLNVQQIKHEASKTIQNVKVTFDALSQKLRRSTRRRCRLESESPDPKLRQKTPIKMYSPFKIDTPGKSVTRFRANGTTPQRSTPRRQAKMQFQSFDSPSQAFRKDVEAVSRGTKHLTTVARGLSTRSSFRNN